MIQPDRFVARHARLDGDAVFAKHGESASVDERKRILHRGDDARDAGGDDALGARARAARVHARFERAVQRGAPRALARLLEGDHLRVRLARALVTPVADDDALGGDDARADSRIRRGAADAAARMLERPPHPPQVRLRRGFGETSLYHFCWNRAST